MKGLIDDAWTLFLGRALSDPAVAELREMGLAAVGPSRW